MMKMMYEGHENTFLETNADDWYRYADERIGEYSLANEICPLGKSRPDFIDKLTGSSNIISIAQEIKNVPSAGYWDFVAVDSPPAGIT